MTKPAAPKTVVDLVERFSLHRGAYPSATYNEVSHRQIDQLVYELYELTREDIAIVGG